MNSDSINILICIFWWTCGHISDIVVCRQLCSALVDTAKYFSKVIVAIYTPISSEWEFWLLYTDTVYIHTLTLDIFYLFYLSFNYEILSLADFNKYFPDNY